MSETKPKWTSEEVVKLIRAKYSGQAWASFEQVADGTGARGHSWIDVAAFGLWPSKGLHRLAFEVKVSRADYLNEVQDPTKNAWARECFHEFWYVAPGGVIKDESEVPEGCGWMQATRGGLRVKRQATLKQDAMMDESLFASLCRSAQAELVRAHGAIRKTVLEEDTGHQTALRWEAAGRRLLAIRGDRGYYRDTTEDEIFAHFEEATVDAQTRSDRDHVLSELGRFRRDVLALGDLFSVLGQVSLLECDELGERIVDLWGGEDKHSLAAARATARGNGGTISDLYSKAEGQRFVASAERLLERARVMIVDGSETL